MSLALPFLAVRALVGSISRNKLNWIWKIRRITMRAGKKMTTTLGLQGVRGILGELVAGTGIDHPAGMFDSFRKVNCPVTMVYL